MDQYLFNGDTHQKKIVSQLLNALFLHEGRTLTAMALQKGLCSACSDDELSSVLLLIKDVEMWMPEVIFRDKIGKKSAQICQKSVPNPVQIITKSEQNQFKYRSKSGIHRVYIRTNTAENWPRIDQEYREMVKKIPRNCREMAEE